MLLPVPHFLAVTLSYLGADAVVMVEDTTIEEAVEGIEKRVKIMKADGFEISLTTLIVEIGQNVRGIGSDVAKGSIVVARNTRISPLGGEIGVLTSIWIDKVKVWRKPVVIVLSTGAELIDGKVSSGQRGVRDSNRPALLAALKHAHFTAIDYGIVTDKYLKLT